MKRLMLATTATIALAGAAFAQSSVDETVMTILDTNGYPESAFDMLTDGEIAELYVAATSGDADSIDDVLAGFNLPSDMSGNVLRESAAPTDVELAVRSVLDNRGYDENAINMLTGGEIASIYSASTSGDANDVNDAVNGAFESSVAMRGGNMSDASMMAVEALMAAGYTAEQIDDVTAAELLQIYTAMSSEDASDVQDAISSVMES